eukprot:Rhum_TRINITY_DN11044_c0_g1::Rhum_TRINITY_DN11044_c0_g1_i1::g.42053::m.42053
MSEEIGANGGSGGGGGPGGPASAVPAGADAAVFDELSELYQELAGLGVAPKASEAETDSEAAALSLVRLYKVVRTEAEACRATERRAWSEQTPDTVDVLRDQTAAIQDELSHLPEACSVFGTFADVSRRVNLLASRLDNAHRALEVPMRGHHWRELFARNGVDDVEVAEEGGGF